MSQKDKKDLYFNVQDKDTEWSFEHKGYTYLIRSNGRHPRAYIVLPEGHELEGVYYTDIHLCVHGGLTYCKYEDAGYVIGWDYAHSGDFTNYEGIASRDGKKWTMEEIKEEAKKAIEEISRLKKFQAEEYYFSEEKLDWR